MGDDDDSQPMLSAAVGQVDVMVQGGGDDDLSDVRGHFDDVFERAVDAASDLDELGPL